MPSAARLHAPGTLVHLIARIVNREFLIGGHEERCAYLDRVPAALERTDWVPLAFALMSNHIHLALIAGTVVPCRFFQGLHRSFAGWLNRSQRRLGPVFAGRPRTIYMPMERVPVLVAYIHNNPVRARLVGAASETDWSSHRMWIGADPPAPWLDVKRALRCAGFEPTAHGQRQFDELVCNGSLDPRDAALAGDPHAADRRTARAELALPVELSSPMHTLEQATVYGARYLGPPALSPRWPGDLGAVVERVSAFTGVPVAAIRSRSHVAGIVRARRLVCIVGVIGLRRGTREVAAELGVTDSAVTAHVRKLNAATVEAARQVEAIVRGLPGRVAV